MHEAVFLDVYVKREPDVRKTDWLETSRLLANRPADTVSSLPSDRRLTRAEHPSEKTDGGQICSVDTGLNINAV